MKIEHGIRSMGRLIAASIRKAMVQEAMHIESADININGPYKPRRLKMDTVHIMARRLNKMRSRDPQYRRKLALRRKKYLQKNGRALKKRAQHVRQVRNQRGLNGH